MIFGKRRKSSSVQSGHYHFENPQSRSSLTGHGDGDFIRLRDEFGNVWTGSAERQGRDMIQYRFRDAKGKTISGISDSYGIVLRDDKGNSWRGYVE